MNTLVTGSSYSIIVKVTFSLFMSGKHIGGGEV